MAKNGRFRLRSPTSAKACIADILQSDVCYWGYSRHRTMLYEESASDPKRTSMVVDPAAPTTKLTGGQFASSVFSTIASKI